MTQQIFTKRTEEEVLFDLKASPSLFHRYLSLDEPFKRKFMDFCTGKRTLPVLYDTVFKRLMNPELHPERLESFLSCLLKTPVKIHAVLPTEDVLIDGESILSMDILVQLDDGSYVLVEVQKVPYYFPAERASCYSSDLLLRQYSRCKREMGKQFSYRKLQKIYTIILYEKSTEALKADETTFIHHAKTTCDTGLKLNFLQEYYLIALDVFQKSEYAKRKNPKDTFTGWLSFFCTETVEDAEELCQFYPWLSELYVEMAQFGQKPEELIGMISEWLRELDRNTVRYMIDDMTEKIELQKQMLTSQEEQLSKNQILLAENEKAIADSEKALAENERALAENERALAQSEQALIANEKALAEKDALLQEQAAEIKHLKSLLANQH